jgi:hypothetical protein
VTPAAHVLCHLRRSLIASCGTSCWINYDHNMPTYRVRVGQRPLDIVFSPTVVNAEVSYFGGIEQARIPLRFTVQQPR